MSAVLERCALAGIRLWMEGPALRYDAPKGAMTEELAADIKPNKPAIVKALGQPPASKRRGLGGYATPAGVPPLGDCELARQVAAIPEGDPVPGVETSDPAVLWWRISITEPSGRTIEVDAPSGWILAEWAAYAARYHGPGCAVTPIAGLPKPRAPVNLEEAIRAACDGTAGITSAQFRALLSPEDLKDIRGRRHPPQDLGRLCRVIRRGRALGGGGAGRFDENKISEI